MGQNNIRNECIREQAGVAPIGEKMVEFPLRIKMAYPYEKKANRSPSKKELITWRIAQSLELEYDQAKLEVKPLKRT